MSMSLRRWSVNKYIIILDTCDGLEELHFTSLLKYLREIAELKHNDIMFDTRIEKDELKEVEYEQV